MLQVKTFGGKDIVHSKAHNTSAILLNLFSVFPRMVRQYAQNHALACLVAGPYQPMADDCATYTTQPEPRVSRHRDQKTLSKIYGLPYNLYTLEGMLYYSNKLCVSTYNWLFIN